MVSDEEAGKIKKQLISHIESNFPEDKKDFAVQQIQSMDNEQLEQFLIQNNLTKTGESEIAQECIFCSIISGKIPSSKIAENEKAIAVLEINPISKGHVLILPKEHISKKEKIPKEANKLADGLSEIIKKKLNPKKVEIYSSNLFGHEILNVLPIYDSESPQSKRSPAKKEDLEKLKEILEEKKKPKKIIIKKVKPKEIKADEKKLWLPRRIP